MNDKKEVNVLVLYTARSLIALVGIWILKLILVSLPFIKELEIPDFSLSMVQIVNIAINLVIIVLLVNYSIGMKKYWPIQFPKSSEMGSVLSSLVLLITLIVGYGCLKQILEAFTNESESLLILQIIFIITAVFVLIRVALIIYQALPKWLNNIKDSLSEPPK